MATKKNDQKTHDGSLAEENGVIAGTKECKETTYSVNELAANAKVLFQTNPECVRAALMEKKIEKCTKSEAKQAVKEFMKKEVK